MIGLTSGRRMVASTKGETRATVLYTTYSSMIRHAGGIPVILTPGPAAEAGAVVARLNGLLMSGGGDVAPSRYGGSPHETVYGVDPLRDEYEFALAAAAYEARLPTLAICRGMQAVNVAFGGTLMEDISSEDPSMLEHRIAGPGTATHQHEVKLDPLSDLATTLGIDSVATNTVHHQALRDVAGIFKVVGRAPDGIIEAIEPIKGDWKMWAVQWHPEYLGEHDEPSMDLFRAFVRAAGATP